MKKNPKNKILALLLSLCLVAGLSFGPMPLIGEASKETLSEENPAPEAAALPKDSADPTAAADQAGTDPAASMERGDNPQLEAPTDPETAAGSESDVSSGNGEGANKEGDVSSGDSEGASRPGQAGIVPTRAGTDYYVVLDESGTKLTFQKDPPGSGVEGTNYWGQATEDRFFQAKTEWHSDNIKSKITTVEFIGEITLCGNSLFAGFLSLQSVNIKEKVTLTGSAQMMFADCSALTEITGIENLDTEKVTSLWSMFASCSSLKSLNLSNFKTSNVTSLLNMFHNCTSLETLTGLENWDTSQVTEIEDIFMNCSSLTSLNLSNWDIENATNDLNMFSGCTSLRELTVGANFHITGRDTGADQIHNSQNTGIWVSKTDKGGPRWTDEEFIKLFEKGNAAATYIWVHTLTYDKNGHEGTAPTDNTRYEYGEDATLQNGDSITASDQEVFIGWSDSPKDLVITGEDAADVLKAGATTQFENSNKTLYAVFAEDKNRNNTPDYEETRVTVTFDINGGDGSKEGEDSPHNTTYKVENKLKGTPLIMSVYATLKWEKAWTKDGSPATHPAILEGWLETPTSDIILENDTDTNGAGLSKQLLNRSQAKVPDSDTTYYAVYAADENGDHIADYRENSVQVEYYANGGTRTDGKWVDNIEGLFYRCSHHHVFNEDGVVLMDLDQGKEYVKRDGATLIGWSKSPISNLVANDSQEKSAGLITTIKMPERGHGNAKVYAVWAEDVNNNGKPDYRENKVTLTFDINHGDGSGDSQHKTTYTAVLLPGTYYDLPQYSDLHWIEKWEKDGQPADFPAVLAGWIQDHPVTDIILEDDINDQAETHEHLSDQMIKQPHIKVPSVDTVYYAIYAADENNDQLPDYLENAEQVEYYANGGTMISGSWLDNIEGLFYRCGHHHVAGEDVTLIRLERGKELISREGAVLLGWSENPVANLVATAEEEASAGLITTLRMPQDGNAKVYAVWAADSNADLIPDYSGGTPSAPAPEAPPESATPSESDAPAVGSAAAPGTGDNIRSGAITTPETGDNSHLGMWFAIAALSLTAIAVICAALLRRRKHPR